MGKGILVKYGEIAIKGNNRAIFENVLIKNIKHALRDLGKLWIEKEQGRLFIPAPKTGTDEWMERDYNPSNEVIMTVMDMANRNM